MAYEIRQFEARAKLNMQVLQIIKYYSNALVLTNKLPIDKYVVYGIYDNVRNKYISFRMLKT